MMQDYTNKKIKTYLVTKKLGDGAWGRVYQAMDSRNNSTVAIKCIPKYLLQRTPKLEELIGTEIKVLRECKNENVIGFVENFNSQSTIFIVTEFCNGGDLEKYLEVKKRLSEEEATLYLKHIINGFKGLHLAKAMHRDFKTANILLHNGMAKIADLGFAKQLSSNGRLTTTVLGTSLTMAPEVHDRKPYGIEADIWSVGAVYYHMLFGRYPYCGGNDQEIRRLIRAGPPQFTAAIISEPSKDFIKGCLTVDPQKRISWAQIYEHPLFRRNVTGIVTSATANKIKLGPEQSIYGRETLTINFPDVFGQFPTGVNRNTEQTNNNANHNNNANYNNGGNSINPYGQYSNQTNGNYQGTQLRQPGVSNQPQPPRLQNEVKPTNENPSKEQMKNPYQNIMTPMQAPLPPLQVSRRIFQPLQNMGSPEFSVNDNQLIKTMLRVQEKNNTIKQYQSFYMARRNGIMFPFIYIVPELLALHEAHRSCILLLLLLSKKLYNQLKQYQNELMNHQNIFDLHVYWTQYMNSAAYQSIYDLLQQDIQITSIQFTSAVFDLPACSDAVSRQTNIEEMSTQWNSTYNDILDTVWYSMADHVDDRDTLRADRLRALDAIEFYRKGCADASIYQKRRETVSQTELVGRIKEKVVDALSFK